MMKLGTQGPQNFMTPAVLPSIFRSLGPDFAARLDSMANDLMYFAARLDSMANDLMLYFAARLDSMANDLMLYEISTNDLFSSSLGLLLELQSENTFSYRNPSLRTAAFPSPHWRQFRIPLQFHAAPPPYIMLCFSKTKGWTVGYGPQIAFICCEIFRGGVFAC